MHTIRFLKKDDIHAAQKLWQDRFGDSDRFMDWYFRERFIPELSAGIFLDNNDLICQAHGRPLKLKIGLHSISVLMIGGVSTDRTYEKQGNMHHVLDFMQYVAKDSGFDALFLAAEHPEIYHSSGFIDCGNCVTVQTHHTRTAASDTVNVENNHLVSDLLKVYQAATLRYDFMPIRDLRQMEIRTRECISAGFQLLTTEFNGTITGYAFYDPESGSTEEVFAENESAYWELLESLPDETTSILPPDQTVFGTMKTLSLIKPLTPFAKKCFLETSLLGYCPETY